MGTEIRQEGDGRHTIGKVLAVVYKVVRKGLAHWRLWETAVEIPEPRG